MLGQFVGNKDIREFGDHNPGATNVMRSLGWRWGIVAFLLDYFKGALPVGIAWFVLEIQSWQIVLIALTPILGHAFSPFLGWMGGKAVAVTFGVWTGLTLGTGPIVFGLLLGIFFVMFKSSSWAVMVAMGWFGLFIYNYYLPGTPEFIAIWFGNSTILLLKHYRELELPPTLRKFSNYKRS
jgi:glycerol-3-phosphate acyltransferase PlsY